jgi:hypothetical protein
MKRVLAVAVGIAMALTVVGAAGASAATPKGSPMVKAVVLNRHMVPGGISVTLSGVTTGAIPAGTQFAWDVQNDGVLETPLQQNPTVTFVYGPMASSSVTATIVVLVRGGTVPVRSSVTFSLRIPMIHGHGPILHGHFPILHGHGPILHGHGPILHGHVPVLHS